MARNASVRSVHGFGQWMDGIPIDDPRFLYCYACDGVGSGIHARGCQNAAVAATPVAPVTPRPVNTITEKQMSYLKSLIDARMVSSTETTKTIAAATKQTANTLYKNGGLTKSIASQLIAALAAVR